MPAETLSPQALLARLVAFDTTSHNTNLPLLDFVQDYLAGHGIESHRVPDETGEKASLYATIGPAGVPGVGLSGHTDVVPVAGQAWDTDPFTLTARDGRLYGRGACDMKGYLACVLAAVPLFTSRKLAAPIHILFSYDEEVGCTGVRPMIAELGHRLTKPRMVFVGEPTTMQVVDAHKGPVRWRIDFKGRAVHSSMAPLGVNTITYAGRILGELARMEQELKAKAPNLRFDPSFTTLQVTQLHSGTANNIVPNEAWLGFEIRALPDCNADEIESRIRRFAEAHCLPEMRAVADEADITVARTGDVPAFAADAGSEIVSLALKLTGSNETFAVSYATEASLFHNAGSPSVVCGPGHIAQAHTANEWIAVAELDKCMAFMRRLADWAEAR